VCIIVYKPVNQPIKLSVLEDCWAGNKDGAGLMFAEDGQLKVAKGFMTLKSFKKYFKKFGEERMTSLPMVFHFRIATHGSVGPANCHPFRVHNDLWFAHNGIITAVDVPKDRDISDSEAFAEQYLAYLHKSLKGGLKINHLSDGKYYGNTPLNEMIGKFIVGSKLVFMNGNGAVAIVNETAGTWEDEIWFSNRTFKRYATTVTTWRGAGNVAGYSWQPTSARSGAACSTPALPSGKSYADEQSEWFKTNGNRDYMCNTCKHEFKRRDARVITWQGSTQVIHCPECKGKDTGEVFELIPETASEISSEDYWECYDCGSWFWADESLGSVETEKATYLYCPWCGGARTYAEKHEDAVEKYGDDFFETPPPDEKDVRQGALDYDEYLSKEEGDASDERTELDSMWDELEKQTAAEWEVFLDGLDNELN